MDNIVEENRRLRRTMRDLVALSTLPAVWVGLGPDGIARSLADVLLSTLSLDLVYVRLAGLPGEDPIEVFASTRASEPGQMDVVRKAIAPVLAAHQAEPPESISDPFGAGTLHIAVTRFGVADEDGVLVTGSMNRDFPTESDRVLLGIGANQTAVVVQRRRAEERVRQSDARKSAILDTALDCIISMDHEGNVLEFNPAAETTFGYRREEAVGRELASLLVPTAMRTQHRASLARYLATGEGSILGKRIELSALRADGTEIPVELAVTRIPAEGPPVFTAYLRDISERSRNERHRNVRLAITQALAQAATVPEAATGFLRAVCEGLGWDLGFFWMLDRSTSELRCQESWHAPDVAASGFEAASRQVTFRRGEGLPGRAWESGEPTWLLDVVEAREFPRASSAAEEGLHGAFACPLVLGNDTLGVVEFFSQRIREPDKGLLETMTTVAGVLGQLLERMQAEDALRESRERLDMALQAADLGHWTLSLATYSATRNFRHDEIFGYESLLPEWTYEMFMAHVLPEDRLTVDDKLQRSVAQGDPWDFECRIRRTDGEVRWIWARGRVFSDGETARRLIGTVADITERKRLEEELRTRIEQLAEADRGKEVLLASLRESEEKLRLLADTIPQLAWMARPDGHIFWYNRRWHEYTGTTLDDMEGWGWRAVHDPDVLPAVMERWTASIASGEPFDMVFPLKGADGQFRPFLTRVNPLRDEEGRILYWFGTNTDISEMKRMEQALRDTDRRKDEFLATLAHELRNPLAPIRNSLQILKMPRVDAATSQRVREMMERQVQHLVRLVDDLLDVSRVMRGKIELRRQPVELATAIARAVEMARPFIDVHSHELEIAHPPDSLLIDADPVRLSQVISNLLTNAAKYTESGGHIRLSAQREGCQAVLRVRDTGIGIAADMLPHVFDLFVQVDHAATRSQGGLGIGLTLVKNLVDLHGGTVEARSDGLGRGCEVIVRLPLLIDNRAEPPEVEERPDAIAPSGHRLLVVDDNEDAANSLAMLLRLQGHEVEVCHDGLSALRVASSFRPALIFLDLGMPRMDGFEVARRIRTIPGLERTILAALTGWGQKEDRRRTAESGFDHHLVKPLEPKVLLGLLGRLELTALD